MRFHFRLLLALLASAASAQEDGDTVAKLQSALQGGTIVQGGGSCCASTASDQSAQLTARPQASGTFNSTTTGLHKLGLSSSGRDGYLFIPVSYTPTKAVPLLVTLHASGRNGLDGLAPLYEPAMSAGVMLLAPESRGQGWDYLLSQSFGQDVAYIDAALQAILQRYNVQQDSIGMQGFSDGATYALSLGLINGDLFSKVIAFSPGGLYAPTQAGMPPVFVSGGNADPLFPIAQGAGYAACTLESAGYRTSFVEFDGGHDVPADVASQGMSWFLGRTQIAGPSEQTCSTVS